MRWWVKAAVQFGLAHTPFGKHLHEWLQVRYGELAHLEKSSRFDNAAFLVETARSHLGRVAGLHVIELGTGWVPAVPLSFLLAGARVDTFDVKKLVRKDPYVRCLQEMKRRLPTLARAAQEPEAVLQSRLALIEMGRDFKAA